MDASRNQPRLVVAAGLVWLSSTRVLLQRRSAGARHGAGMLEFPGGKVERGEAPARALARELAEEWGPAAVALRVGPVAELLHHVYAPPGPEVLLCVFHVDAGNWGDLGWQGAIVLEPGAEAEAHVTSRLPVDAFLEADRPFARAIAEGRVTPPGGW